MLEREAILFTSSSKLRIRLLSLAGHELYFSCVRKDVHSPFPSSNRPWFSTATSTQVQLSVNRASSQPIIAMLFTLPSALLPTLLLLSNPTTAYKPLSDAFLRAIPSPDAAIDYKDGPLLAPLLIPRVPGTPGQILAQQHLVSYFQTELPAWNISWQNSTSTTPTSRGAELPFANLVVKREPPWVSKGQANLLTLVAHYDSKLQPSGFIGATDSAAPCAMLMHIAKVIDPYIQRMYDEMSALQEGGTVDMDMGIQILFLDGEEAFENWSDTDSLYGSRCVHCHFPILDLTTSHSHSTY